MLIYIIIFSVIIVASLIACIVVKMYSRKKTKKASFLNDDDLNMSIKLKKMQGKAFSRTYRFYSKTPILRKYFSKISKSVESIYPADIIYINKKSTKIMTTGLIGVFVVMAFVSFISGFDPLYILIGFIISAIIFRALIEGGLATLQNKLLKQFNESLEDIGHHYNDIPIVDAAIYSSMAEAPYEMSLHLNQFYQILTSVDVQKKMEEYIEISPNKYFTLFLSICSTIQSYNDKPVAEGGTLFISRLNKLKEEVGTELINRRLINELFASLSWIALLPVVLVKIIEKWATSNMPEIASFYSGSSGTILLIVILLVSLASYNMVNNLKHGNLNEKASDKSWNKLADLPIFNKMLNREINAHYTKSLRVGDKLHITGSKITYKGYLAKKICYAIFAFIATIIISFIAINKEKVFVISAFDDAFSSSYATENEEITMIELAKTEAEYYKDYKEANEEIIAKNIKSTNELGSETLINDVAVSVMESLNKYNDTYYKYYYFVIALIVSAIAFKVPDIALSFKHKIIDMDKEDEVAQFQTIILILMHFNEVSVSTLLTWMEKFAFCFKSQISDCILVLERGEHEALVQLKEAPGADFVPFKHLIDNMLNIDKVGVETAFIELEQDRALQKENRKMTVTKLTKSKARKAKRFAYIPCILVIAFYLILPIAMMGVGKIVALQSSLSM